MGEITQLTIASPTGAQLNAYSMSSEAPRAVIQINHGIAEHAKRYSQFQTTLSDAGFASIAHDHRGHGHTIAPNTKLGRYAETNGHQLVIEDIEAMHRHIGETWPNLPIITFGHSAGGFMALNFAISNPQASKAVAVWNSNFSAGLLGRLGQLALAYEKFRLGSDVPSRITPALSFDAWNEEFAPNRTAFDWLSGDETEVDKYIADPLCGFPATVSMWQDILKLVFRGASNAELAKLPKVLPMFILGGSKDPATNGGKASSELAERSRKLGMGNIKLEIMPGARHETLNELCRQEATDMFIQWVKAVLA